MSHINSLSPQYNETLIKSFRSHFADHLRLHFTQLFHSRSILSFLFVELTEMGWHADLVPVGGCGYRVLGCQRYAASGDHQQDGHFKIPEVHHVVTCPTHPAGQQAKRNVQRGPASMSASCDSRMADGTRGRDSRVVVFEDEHAVWYHSAGWFDLFYLLLL